MRWDREQKATLVQMLTSWLFSNFDCDESQEKNVNVVIFKFDELRFYVVC
jgi:hypothetical protein